jgi:hypothetical protein
MTDREGMRIRIRTAAESSGTANISRINAPTPTSGVGPPIPATLLPTTNDSAAVAFSQTQDG